MCCVLVLTIFELGGATSVGYEITESKKDQGTITVSFIVGLLVPTAVFAEKSVNLTFTAKSVNPLALSILTSAIKVLVIPGEMKTFTTYSGEFEVQVSVTADTDNMLIGDLNATLSCDHPILCEDKIDIVIVKETKSKCIH